MGKGDDTRKAILGRALELASEVGLKGLAIGALASAVGMSKSGLYAHFDSKEALEVAVLAEARDRFVATVIAPALKRPRGEPRARALFEAWLRWEEALPGGCVFMAAGAELDDRPGPVRDFLVATQRDWVDSLRITARTAIEDGAFRSDVEPAQWAFELYGMFAAYHHYARLLHDPQAAALASAPAAVQASAQAAALAPAAGPAGASPGPSAATPTRSRSTSSPRRRARGKGSGRRGGPGSS